MTAPDTTPGEPQKWTIVGHSLYLNGKYAGQIATSARGTLLAALNADGDADTRRRVLETASTLRRNLPVFVREWPEYHDFCDALAALFQDNQTPMVAQVDAITSEMVLRDLDPESGPIPAPAASSRPLGFIGDHVIHAEELVRCHTTTPAAPDHDAATNSPPDGRVAELVDEWRDLVPKVDALQDGDEYRMFLTSKREWTEWFSIPVWHLGNLWWDVKRIQFRRRREPVKDEAKAEGQTPRTDKFLEGLGATDASRVRLVDFARTLERELIVEQSKNFADYTEAGWNRAKELEADLARAEQALAEANTRDGKWLDKWGACRVCNGELPYGHIRDCELYKIEQERDSLRTQLADAQRERDALIAECKKLPNSPPGFANGPMDRLHWTVNHIAKTWDAGKVLFRLREMFGTPTDNNAMLEKVKALRADLERVTRERDEAREAQREAGRVIRELQIATADGHDAMTERDALRTENAQLRARLVRLDGKE